jgi:anaerobic magnesium-protoporphyrin IX monomethyl ester cyclase
VVSFARGCVQQCSFCSQQRFWERSWRSHSPEHFVAELSHLKETYGVNVVMIADEAPTTNEQTWRRLIDLLIEADLGIEILLETRVTDILRDETILPLYRRAGIVHIYVGVESGSQATLDRFKKNLKVEQSKQAIALINSHDIISETSFVLGMPEETPQSIKETIKLAKYYDPDMAFFLAIAPWPYSDIYDELKPYIEVWDYSQYNLVEPVIRPGSMTREELSKELLKAFKTFYIGKLSRLPQMSKFKRDYVIAVARLLASHSYLSEQMKGMAGMPTKIHAHLAELLGERTS